MQSAEILAIFLTGVLAPSVVEYLRSRMARSERIYDRRIEFDRGLLIDLQESLQRLGLLVIALVEHEATAYRETGTWTTPNPLELDQQFNLESMTIQRLASRVHDAETRQLIGHYLDATDLLLRADSFEHAAETVRNTRTIFDQIMARTGAEIRKI